MEETVWDISNPEESFITLAEVIKPGYLAISGYLCYIGINYKGFCDDK